MVDQLCNLLREPFDDSRGVRNVVRLHGFCQDVVKVFPAGRVLVKKVVGGENKLRKLVWKLSVEQRESAQ